MKIIIIPNSDFLGGPAWANEAHSSQHRASEWITGWLTFCTHYLTEVLQKPHVEKQPFQSNTDTHPGKWKNVAILTDSLGSGGCNFPFANAKAASIQSAFLCFHANQHWEESIDFSLSFSFPLPYSYWPIPGTSFCLWRWKSQREEEEDLRRWCKHFIMWQDMNTSTAGLQIHINYPYVK